MQKWAHETWRLNNHAHTVHTSLTTQTSEPVHLCVSVNYMYLYTVHVMYMAQVILTYTKCDNQEGKN